MKRSIIFFTVFLLLGAGSYAHAAKPEPLDGKTFIGQVGSKGKPGDPDNFIFKNGHFDSEACHQYGYGDAPYTAKNDGKKMSFESTTTNTGGDKIMWKGNVMGNAIEGTAVRMSSKGETLDDMWFKGSVKK